MKPENCYFTGRECTGGEIYDDGSIGCGLLIDGECTLLEDVPDNTTPRDYYIDLLMQLRDE